MDTNASNQFEAYLQSIKGSFTPEQFGVFLNMYSWDIEDNYLILAHETFHHWQSIFTPYGHLKWGCARTVSSEIIDLWIQATNETPSNRPIPAADIIPCKSIHQAKHLSEIFVQDLFWQVFTLEERLSNLSSIAHALPIPAEDLCPVVTLDSKPYQLNGIDILESWAKYYEATLAYLTEEKCLSEVINPSILRPEYYIALEYFINKIGSERIIEFPVACELALHTSKICRFDKTFEWKKYHPGWRFVTIVEEMSNIDPQDYLNYKNIKNRYIPYTEMILERCNFESRKDSWAGAIEYANQTDLNIPNNMKDAIEFINRYPWALSFPLLDINVYKDLKQFFPYYVITSDNSYILTNSTSLANEVAFENNYMALYHQICGHMSNRCMDRGKIQCGFSYYGINVCRYFQDGSCTGHVDRDSELPDMKLDSDSNILEGCLFKIFLNLIGINLQDITIKDINSALTSDIIIEDIRRLQRSHNSENTS